MQMLALSLSITLVLTPTPLSTRPNNNNPISWGQLIEWQEEERMLDFLYSWACEEEAKEGNSGEVGGGQLIRKKLGEKNEKKPNAKLNPQPRTHTQTQRAGAQKHLTSIKIIWRQ